MKRISLLLFSLIIILFVSSSCAPTIGNAEFDIPASTLDAIKSDCIEADTYIFEYPLSKEDIIVERVITGSFHGENDCLLVLTLTDKASVALHHLEGFEHYYFVVMDSSLKTTKSKVFVFAGDSVSYSTWRGSYEESKDYLFLSGVYYSTGDSKFFGGVYDSVDWTPVWIPEDNSLSPNQYQLPVFIGDKIFVFDTDINLCEIPHINSEFELETILHDVPPRVE